MLKRHLVWVALIPATVLLAGCWDRTEVNDVAFVTASAFDKEGDQYRVTVQFPLTGQLGGANGGGGGTSGEKTWYLDSALGQTIKEAIASQQTSLSRELYFAHRRVLLVGEELCRSGISLPLDIVARIPQNRLTALIIVTKGQARNLLHQESVLEQVPSETLRELTVRSMKKAQTVKHVLNILQSEGIDLALPYFVQYKTQPGDNGKPKQAVKLEGMAVFKRDKLVGYLRGEDASGLLWAMNQADRPSITVPSPKGEGNISIEFAKTDVRLAPHVEDGEIQMDIAILASGGIVDNESNYMAKEDYLMSVQRAAELKLKSMVEKSVRLLQKEYGSDAIGFGDALYRKYPKEWQKVRDEWDSRYPKVKVSVKTQVHLKNSGTLMKPISQREGDAGK